MMTQKMA